MKINVQTELPAPGADQLTALIDLGEDRPLYTPEASRSHPAWADLERRRALDTDRCAAYLATGEAPLIYLPATDAKYWDDEEKIRILASRALEAAEGRKARELVVLLDGPAGGAAAALAAEGIALRAYKFEKYKSKPDVEKTGARSAKEVNVTLVVAQEALKEARAAVERAVERVDSTNRARDLVNEPGSVVTPETLEEAARKIARDYGLGIEVLHEKQLEKEGYNGLLAVGRGGNVPPRMIVLTYDPAAGSPKKGAKGKGKKTAGGAKGKAAQAAAAGSGVHLGLLGKGITFDSGGYSIKPATKMWEMKGDMSGAAAVLCAMEAIAREKLPIRVTAVVVTAQNLVDKRAQVPGDVFKAKNGKFVHVDNTDAEGRLILTDGLWRLGEEEKVTHLVDVATLTGACVRALGTSISGVLGNDEFADEVAGVAAAQGEPCWRLPIVEEYMEWLKTDVADINNVTANGLAGASTAALFLREFLPAGIHWAHLDVAGTFIAEASWKYYRPGATGIMVRTLAALAEKMAG